jgi:4-oxalocrotonate tautomerase
MPLIEVKTFAHRLDDRTVNLLVGRLTDALCSVVGEGARSQTWVVVEGVPAERWGIAGVVGKAPGDQARDE